MTEIIQSPPKLLSFPREIVIEILKRLPLESLIQSIVVCKQWRSLILTDRHFNKAHAEHSKRTPWKHSYFLSWTLQRTLVLSTVDCNCGYSRLTDDNANVQPHILGSCDGLFFMEIRSPFHGLKNDKGNFSEFVLWNPYTNSMKTVRELDHGDQFLPLISGLGYDYKTGDYKAITVIGTLPRGYKEGSKLNQDEFIVCMFSLQRNSWMLLEDSDGILSKYIFDSGFGSTTFSGIPHWVGQYQSTVTAELGFGLVCFDPEMEMLREMPLPDKINSYAGKCGVQISVLEGCLCTAVTLVKINVVEVWTMKEYGVDDSWTKLYAIKLPNPTNSRSLKPLGYSSQGKLVMVSIERTQATYRLISDPEYFLDRVYWTCDVNGNATRDYYLKFISPSTSIIAESYTESLIWPVKEETLSRSILVSLPRETLQEILKRLPLKSLIRSTIVCKQWRSLILTDPQFNAQHSEHVKRSPWRHPFFISWEPPSMKSTFDYNFDWDDIVPYGRDDNVLQPHILGSCDGLFFMEILSPSQSLEDDEGNCSEFVLWNPYTNSVKAVSELEHGDPMISGLGYDYRTGDYKAIMVIDIQTRGYRESSRLRRKCNFLVCMFSFQGNSWKLLSSNGILSKYKFEPDFASTTFNGIPHWVGQYHSKVTAELGFGLVCFDPEMEMFREMPLPDKSCNYAGKCGVQIGILGGCLSAAVTLLSINVVEVWAMKQYGVKYSWTKVHAVKLLKPTHSISLKPLGYSNEGKLMMMSVEYPDNYPLRAYWSCDVNGDATAIQLFTAFFDATSVVSEAYTESLIWPVKEESRSFPLLRQEEVAVQTDLTKGMEAYLCGGTSNSK